jgi:hypothetical protein
MCVRLKRTHRIYFKAQVNVVGNEDEERSMMTHVELELHIWHASFNELKTRECEARAGAHLALPAAVLNGCAHAAPPEVFLSRLKQLP